MDDGTVNPEVRMMEDSEWEDDQTKMASTTGMQMLQSLLGVVNCNTLTQISGIFMGHDLDRSPLEQSGKIIIPAKGPIKGIILVSHFTIGANYECPSETFPLEAVLATKGYAVFMADYIGFGITADRIHPYLHKESSARSVVDMALAALPYLEHIGRSPESDEVFLCGYSQGGSNTLAVMDFIQENYHRLFPITKTYAGGGPYDLAATFDKSMELGVTGIPCAIPMIVQGANEGEKLGLQMEDFFKPHLLKNYDEWINSKKYTVKQINQLINSNDLREIMTDEARDKHSPETALLYKALLTNSTLTFRPYAPVFLFHSRQDQTVPFINAQKAERLFKGIADVTTDFGDYGKHAMGALRFILTVYKDLP